VKRWVLALALTLAAPARIAAQDSTAVTLQHARDLYERLELERALPLLRLVVSPAWPFEVTGAQRVEAHKYLGALLVLAGQRDSALTEFRAALEHDASTDLDPLQFTPAQLAAFDAARRLVFALGVRPVTATRLDPRADRVAFTIVTTHSALVRAEVRPTASGAGATVFAGETERLREIAWDGVLGGGVLAPSGRYALIVRGQSRLLARTDSATVYFDVRQDAPRLEDTLPLLRAGDLLPERTTAAGLRADLFKGLGVAAGAFVIANVATNRDLGRPNGMAVVMSAAGVAAGVTAFFGRRGRPLPENVAANVQLRAERLAANEAIRSRNAVRGARTTLLITPAAGTTR
jgi:hypothetical protein